ncbi:MAG: polyprenyl synthetase family protein [Candidatus Hydrogenedentota bacterium]|nr:MAG: polyprenyl synthetase family protein [Candidatus Hydrogenedentota bacterium]
MKEFLIQVGEGLLSRSRGDFQEGGRVGEAAWYVLEGGGKRLRPGLLLGTVCALRNIRLEEVGEHAWRAAKAFEYIHTYSLIHDDLPLLDDDALRRGRPSCHKVFGVATAVRAGLFLLGAAFLALDPLEEGFRIPMVRLLEGAAGVRGMVGGQALDILGEGREATGERLEEIHLGKTASLIRASLVGGAIVARAPGETIAAMGEVGRAAGLAFQIVDDLLDVSSTEEAMGKPVGADGEHKKTTYPSVLGIEESRRRAAELIERSVEGLKKCDAESTILTELLRFVFERRS